MIDVCIAWKKALRKIWKLSPMTHCNVVALVAESKPLEVSLRQRFCKFSPGIDKDGLLMLHGVIFFSVYCNNYVDISGIYDDDLNVCYNNMIMNNVCNNISGELRGNVSILRDKINVRDGVKECDSLCIDDVLVIIDDICIN